MKQAGKRKTSSPPPVGKEEPNLELSKKQIIYEKIFPMKEMKDRPEGGWTINYLEKNQYQALGMNFDDEVYPRLVRLFYQNLKFGKDDNGFEYFDFSIDGFKRRITSLDMSKITNLPLEYTTEKCPYLSRPLEFPNTKGNLEFLRMHFSEDKSKGKGDSLILSTLPEQVWLLDRILRENVYPLGHHSERRAELLYALYSAYTGHFYSMPCLFMRGIIKMTQEIRTRTPTGKAKPLPYGFLITAILRFAGYPINEYEPQMHVDPYLPLSAWAASYGRLDLARKKKKAEKEREEAGAAVRISTSSPPTTSTATTDSDIIKRITKMEENQTTLQSQHDRIIREQKRLRRDHGKTDSIIRALARHSIGDDYQARIDTYESEVAQRGKATAAAEDSGGSDYEDEESSSGSESD